MVFLKIRPSKLAGEAKAPPSKSYTHRAFIVALLSRGKSEITNPLLSFDTKATVEAIKQLGAEVNQKGDVWRVEGTAGKLKPLTGTIDVRNSGTTIRMMSAIAALSPKPIRLSGDESILKRPMGPLVEALEKLGAKARCEGAKGRPPVVVGGGLSGGEVEISGAISSQFISALLLACPYASGDTELHVTELRSRPYVEVTLEFLDRVGARIKHWSNLREFSIRGGQVFKPINVGIPGDFSSAALLLSAAVLAGGEVSVCNLDMGSIQGDKRVVSILQEFGADIRAKGDAIKVSGGEELTGVEVDCGDTPDLVPALAVVGSVAEGRTKLINIPHLRYKETDRLQVLASELRKLGAEVQARVDGLHIRGVKRLKGAALTSYGDHRMAMALGVAGLIAEGGTLVSGAESIPVSYPSFVDDMRKLGAQMEIVK